MHTLARPPSHTDPAHLHRTHLTPFSIKRVIKKQAHDYTDVSANRCWKCCALVSNNTGHYVLTDSERSLFARHNVTIFEVPYMLPPNTSTGAGGCAPTDLMRVHAFSLTQYVQSRRVLALEVRAGASSLCGIPLSRWTGTGEERFLISFFFSRLHPAHPPPFPTCSHPLPPIHFLGMHPLLTLTAMSL